MNKSIATIVVGTITAIGAAARILKPPKFQSHSTETRCKSGYVRSMYANCVPGYDPAKEPIEVRSTYEEFVTYGSVPFRRGDVR